MNRLLAIMIVFFILIAGSVSAEVVAKIVTDDTPQPCSLDVETDPSAAPDHTRDNCRSLKVHIDPVDDPSSLIYTVDNAKPGTRYTMSFEYKVNAGNGFDFSLDSEYLSPDVDGVTTHLEERDWDLYTITFDTLEDIEDTVTVTLRFAADSPTTFFLDNLQFIGAPEYTRFNNFQYDRGCCPAGFCWLGQYEVEVAEQGEGGTVTKTITDCVHDQFYENNVKMPPIGVNVGDFAVPGPSTALSGIEMVNAPSGFRCIDGAWKFSRVKFSPLYDAAGFCPDDSQCFTNDPASILAADNCVDSGTVIGYNIEERSDADRIGSSAGFQDTEYFYCHEGNWTTRTKEIALQMVEMARNAGPDAKYTIFCDDFRRSLNSYLQGDLDLSFSTYRDYMGDDITSYLSSGALSEFCVMELNGMIIAGTSLNNDVAGNPLQINDPLTGVRDCGGFLGEGDIDPCCDVTDEGTIWNEDRCPASEPSFIQLIKGMDNGDYCDAAIGTGASRYVSCNYGDVMYNPALRTVIFAKPHDDPDERQLVPYEPPEPAAEQNFIGRVWTAIKDFLGRLLGIATLTEYGQFGSGEPRDFIERAGSFDKLYISHSGQGPDPSGSRDIYAVREIRKSWTKTDERPAGEPDGIPDTVVDHGFKSFISAEYHNYATPICRFFYDHALERPTIEDQISKVPNIQCTPVIDMDDADDPDVLGWRHVVYVEEPTFEEIPDADVQLWIGYADSFWNDITAKIRTQDLDEIADGYSGGMGGTEPVITHTPASVVVGRPVMFVADIGDVDPENILAYTWDFGDGTNYSSYLEDRVEHVFEGRHPEGSDGYVVRLCVLDADYEVACSSSEVPVTNGPYVTIIPQEQSPADMLNSAGTDGTTLLTLDVVVDGLPEDDSTYAFQIDWGDCAVPGDCPTDTVFSVGHPGAAGAGVLVDGPGVMFQHEYRVTPFDEWADFTVSVEGLVNVEGGGAVPFDNAALVSVQKTWP